MKLTKTEWAVLVLTLLGALIRFWNISFQTTNWDEEWTINFARPALSLLQLTTISLTTDCNPPLYYLTAHISMVLLGMTATAIRIPSAIAGTLLIPVMYFIGKEYRDELFGLMSAGYATIFYNFIFYSKFGRSYSICLLFFSLAFLYFMRARNGDKRAEIWFAACTVCAVWTHLYSSIPLGIMAIYLVKERKALTSLGIILIGCVPLLTFIPLIIFGRNTALSGTNFGFTPLQILYLTPPDVFGYSAFITLSIILWILWTRRNDPVLRIISLISLGTLTSMVILSTITPVMMHYAIFLVPMLIVPLILPFYERVMGAGLSFTHLCAILVILVLEAVQIAAIAVVQRSWSF